MHDLLAGLRIKWHVPMERNWTLDLGQSGCRHVLRTGDRHDGSFADNQSGLVFCLARRHQHGYHVRHVPWLPRLRILRLKKTGTLPGPNDCRGATCVRAACGQFDHGASGDARCVFHAGHFAIDDAVCRRNAPLAGYARRVSRTERIGQYPGMADIINARAGDCRDFIAWRIRGAVLCSFRNIDRSLHDGPASNSSNSRVPEP